MIGNLYDNIKELQLIFQTLADFNRLKIVLFIEKNESSVTQIVEATQLSQPLISHHLKTLRDTKILETKRNGPFIYYSLRDIRLLDVLKQISDMIKN